MFDIEQICSILDTFPEYFQVDSAPSRTEFSSAARFFEMARGQAASRARDELHTTKPQRNFLSEMRCLVAAAGKFPRARRCWLRGLAALEPVIFVLVACRPQSLVIEIGRPG